MPLKYNRLDQDKSEIRLLEIQVDEESGIINAYLYIASLNDKPHYYALSYVWGDPLDLFQTDAVVNDHPVVLSARSFLNEGVSELRFHIPEPTLPYCLMVDGEEVSIMKNLGHAIERIAQQAANSSDDKPYLIWIDAICINQEDLEEKVYQVPLMGTIYENAMAVIAYLGYGDDSVVEAMRVLEQATLHILHSDPLTTMDLG